MKNIEVELRIRPFDKTERVKSFRNVTMRGFDLS